jgi:hypothetical protein
MQVLVWDTIILLTKRPRIQILSPRIKNSPEIG